MVPANTSHLDHPKKIQQAANPRGNIKSPDMADSRDRGKSSTSRLQPKRIHSEMEIDCTWKPAALGLPDTYFLPHRNSRADIGRQLHKDNVDAQKKEEEKDDDEEEYFDKELVQLINQRREQNRPDDNCCTSKEQEKDRYQRRREDHLLFKEGGPQDWHCGAGSGKVKDNSRQGNYQHPALNVNHRHLPDSRGRPDWHLNSPSNRHQTHGGGSRHSNPGGPTSWH
ncbi:Hypothetical predicted protein [Pelobates cultripes]|uniref:Uncharacterized protein n=1 Tax=Pelobates cultripes TaxID=61616 RepID=A0AAD1WYN1_PELCU|nr:Hypothetical predicted protein [Pelobates cultripes]